MSSHDQAPVIKSVAFVDTAVADYQLLISSLDPNTEIVLISGGDGLAQIAQWAQDKSGYDTVYLISHGGSGQLQLGDLIVDSATIEDRLADLNTLGSALTESADIMVLGCDVAAGEAGKAFVEQLALATGADVAASNDPTGSALLGGDWDLEITTGNIEAAPLSDSVALQDYSGLLAVTTGTITFSSGVSATPSHVQVNGLTFDGFNWASASQELTVDSSYLTNNVSSTRVLFKSVDGSEFAATSFYLYNGGFTAGTTFSIYGFLNGARVSAATASTNLGGGSYTTVVLNSAFEFVDEVRITSTEPSLNFIVDDVVISAAVVPDTTPPAVASVSVPSNDTYGIGESLDFTVNFSESVTVNTGGGTPRISLTLDTGGTVYANYLSGSGTSALVFRYTVQSGNADANGITVGSLSTNGGTLQDAAGNNATVTLNSVGSTAAVLVDGIVPTISAVTSSSANGTYGVGDVISIQVSFSESVTVTGTPLLTLETGTTDRVISYASGSGTNTLSFTYTVQPGDTSSDLDYISTSALSLNGGTIRDAGGNDATLTLPSPGGSGSLSANSALVIDAVPTMTSATYEASTGVLVVTGTNLWATGGALNDVIVSKLTITGEGGSVYTLTSNNVEITNATSFTVSLNATDKDALNQILNKAGTTSTGSTTYNIAGAAGWLAADASASDATGNSVTVSNVSVPTITSATLDVSTGTLVVTGTGFLKLSGASNDIDVSKLALTGEGGSTYTLSSTSVEITNGTSFTVVLNATDLAYVGLLFNKNGTSSTSSTTYNLAAAEDWAAGADAAVTTVDATNGVTASNVPVPAITSATYDGNTGTLVVTGSGFSQLSGSNNDIVASKFTLTGEGGAAYTLTDTSSVDVTSGTSFTLILSATDKAGVDAILNKNGTSSLDATTYNLAAAEDWSPGADAALVTADLTGNGITVSNAVDTTPPTVTSVSVPSNDTYGIGESLDFTVNVSESVTVNTGGGTPRIALTLDTGGTVYANYLSGSGTSALVFRYTVQSGDADADGITVGALSANGGTLQDAAGNDATLTLNSVGSTAAVLVDAVNHAPSLSGLNGAPTFTEGGSAVTLDADVTASDSYLSALNGGNGDYSGASLTIARNGGANSSDSFDFDTSGALFTVSGGNLQSGGTFATFTNSSGTLTITFTSSGTSATSALVNNVLQHIQYSNSANDPSTSVQLNWEFSDGNGGTQGSGGALTATGSTTVTVSGVNDAPTMTATGADPTFTEGGSAATLFASAAVSTIESGQTIEGLTFTVTNVSDVTESLTIDGTTVNLTNGNSGTTATNSLGYTVSVTSGTATVTLSGGTLSTTQTQTLVDALAYANSSDAPSTGSSRVITITSIQDSGGTTSGGVDTSALSLSSAVTLAAVNDAPSVTGLPTDITVTEDTASDVDLSAATFTDVDTSGSITVTLTAGAGTLIASSGGSVTVSGSGTAALTLSGTATAIDTYLNTASNVQYTGASNAAGNNATTLTVTADDGSGSVTLGTVNVDIANVNDAPAISSNGGGATASVNAAENQTAVTTVTVTDADSDTPSFAITGGADQALFAINAATGVLTFLAAPDFEAPGDADAGNDYVVEVTASDGNGGTDTQTITVTVTDVTEAAPAEDDPAPTVTPTTTTSTTRSTVDGVPVVTTIGTDGNQTIAVTVPSSAGTSVAIPITTSGGGLAGITVGLQPSVTITASGSGSVLSPTQASSSLLSVLESTGTPVGMSSGLGSFLNGLGSNVQVSSSSVVVTGSGGTASSPIVFSGSSGGSVVDVLVIDTSSLPSGGHLQLDNIEFAAIVGSATITGGAGSNVLFADDATQYIRLGADDDTLHGGGGNDTVGSQGGDDWLYGDEGDDTLFGGDGHNVLHGGEGFDTALFSSNRSDYLIVASGGQTTVSPLTDPDTVDTLVNIEQLQFADQTLTVESSHASSIVTLYQNILSRQADTDGLTFWVQQLQNGATVGQLALTFIESSEFAIGTGTDIAYVDVSAQVETLYQAILNRVSDESGKSYWLQKLGSGANLTDVATAFVQSSEFEQAQSDATTWNFFV